MKKEFYSVEIEIVLFNQEDVVRTSGNTFIQWEWNTDVFDDGYDFD